MFDSVEELGKLADEGWVSLVSSPRRGIPPIRP